MALRILHTAILTRNYFFIGCRCAIVLAISVYISCKGSLAMDHGRFLNREKGSGKPWKQCKLWVTPATLIEPYDDSHEIVAPVMEYFRSLYSTLREYIAHRIPLVPEDPPKQIDQQDSDWYTSHYVGVVWCRHRLGARQLDQDGSPNHRNVVEPFCICINDIILRWCIQCLVWM